MTKIQVDYSKPARTRIAPSPTGEIQIGNLRTILYDYALAKKTGGQFVLRLEDTDQKRYVEGAEKRVLQLLKDYGLFYDEGPDIGGPYEPYTQIERHNNGIYKNIFDKLLDEKKVYRCFCTTEELEEKRQKAKAENKQFMYDKTCKRLSDEEIKTNLESEKTFTIRIKMPENEIIEFNDPMRGKMSWKSADVDDYVLAKSNGIPTYHGAVVIDDYLMKITHVFRGSEWIPTTPVYLQLAKYLNFEPPIIYHLSVLLNPSGSGKMSKRKNGDIVFARSYLDKGYVPQAMLNYLMFLGWSHPDEKVNLLSLEEFTKVFSLERLQPQPPKLDLDKLNWYGGQYIRRMTNDELLMNVRNWFDKIENDEINTKAQIWKERQSQDEEKFKNVLRLTQERMRKYSDLFDQAEFFYTKPGLENIDWEKTKHTKEEALGLISELKDVLANNVDIGKGGVIPPLQSWTQESWEGAIRSFADKNTWKAGDMFMLLRLLIVGSPFSPNLLECMNVIGVEESLERIKL